MTPTPTPPITQPRKLYQIPVDDGGVLTYRKGDKSDPLFPQWFKIANACWNKQDENYPIFGGAQIGFLERWLDFDQFKADMGPSYEDRPDKPAMHRRIYLSRRNPRAGFNPQNAVWVTKPEAMKYQKKTIRVATPFGKSMTLRELETYLRDNDGEEFPDGRKYELRVREYNEHDRLVTVTKIIDTISPVPIHELRRRVRNATDLFRPVRPYGDSEDKQEDQACKRADERRERLIRMARDRGIPYEKFVRTHDDNGIPFQT